MYLLKASQAGIDVLSARLSAVASTVASRGLSTRCAPLVASKRARLKVWLPHPPSLSQMSSGWRGAPNWVMLSPDVGRLQIALVAAHRVIPITSEP